MDNKAIKVYQFLLKDFERKLKPFKFSNATVYYISDNDSGYNLSYILSENFKKKRYDFVYLPATHNRIDEDLKKVYQYYEPSGKLFLNEISDKAVKNKNISFFSRIKNFFKPTGKIENLSKINKLHHVDVLLQFLGIEEKSKDIFIYTRDPKLYVILINETLETNTSNVIDEIIQIIPDNSIVYNYTDILYSPIRYNPEQDEDYFKLDDETKKSVKEISDKFNQFNKTGQFLAILPFIEKQISIIKNRVESELSSLYIDNDYRVFLKDYDKEVKMSHLSKSLYFLFLIKEEIDLTEIYRLTDELLVIYKHVSNQENINKMQESVSQLLKNENNELYVHFSRIKSAFCKVVTQDIAKNYYIIGAKTKPKSVTLDRKLTNINDLHNIWFPDRVMFNSDALEPFRTIAQKDEK